MAEVKQRLLHRIGVQAPEEYWSQDQDYLRLRIRTKMMNVVYGLKVGDQVATEGDPQVQGAAGLFGRVKELLKPATDQASSAPR